MSPPLPPYPQEYPQEPNEITRLSFERVRESCPDIVNLPAPLQPLAVRMIHACGNPEILSSIRASENFPQPLLTTPVEDIPVLCDSAMLQTAVRQYAPHAQCLTHDTKTKLRARQNNITKAMAAIDQYCENNNAENNNAENNVVAETIFLFGAAPTALLRLLWLVEQGRCPKPKAVFAFPVGFVSAVESKQALLEMLNHHPFPAITLLGRLGGSAIAAAAFNATFLQQKDRKAKA